MVFLKLVHTEYQVNYETQPFWVNVVHLVPNVQTLDEHDVGPIRLAPTTTLHFNQPLKSKHSVPHWNFYFLLKQVEKYIIYDVVSVATCPNKNDGAKTAKRWYLGSKNSKTLFRVKNLLSKIENSY